MRAVWLSVLAIGCSFQEGWQAPANDAATPVADGPRHDAIPGADARPIDASPLPDAPLTACQIHATAKSSGRYYFATADNLKYNDAENECASWGARLTKITSSNENSFVTTNFTGTGSGDQGYTWIGLLDPLDNNIYVWLDGSLLGFNYNAFPFEIPPISDNNCIDTNGTWRAADCSLNKHGGTCECD